MALERGGAAKRRAQNIAATNALRNANDFNQFAASMRPAIRIGTVDRAFAVPSETGADRFMGRRLSVTATPQGTQSSYSPAANGMASFTGGRVSGSMAMPGQGGTQAPAVTGNSMLDAWRASQTRMQAGKFGQQAGKAFDAIPDEQFAETVGGAYYRGSREPTKVALGDIGEFDVGIDRSKSPFPALSVGSDDVFGDTKSYRDVFDRLKTVDPGVVDKAINDSYRYDRSREAKGFGFGGLLKSLVAGGMLRALPGGQFISGGLTLARNL